MEPASGPEPPTCRLRMREPRTGFDEIQTHGPYRQQKPRASIGCWLHYLSTSALFLRLRKHAPVPLFGKLFHCECEAVLAQRHEFFLQACQLLFVV